MTNTININIRNCCCTGGGTTTTGVCDEPITDLPDPTGIDGPPSGWGPPSSISDRQCKVAVFLYEWLYWWLDTVLNNSVATFFVNLMTSNSVPFVARAALAYALTSLISGVFGSLVTWGIDISDVVIAPASAILGLVLASSLVNVFQTYTITLSVVEDVHTKLPDYRDMIICKLSQAESQSEIYAGLEFALDDAGFSDGQIALVFAVMPPTMLGLLYWSADWWPSFDDETLASITDTCCGALLPGYPLLPGTDVRCNAANYVFDLLLQLFNNTHDTVTGYSAFPLIPLDAEEFIFEDIQGGHPETGDEAVVIPRKIELTAYSMPLFYRGLARFMAYQYTFGNWVDFLASNTTFSGLVSHFVTNTESIICGLYGAQTAGEASGVLLDEIAAYLLTTDLSSEEQIYINQAMTGIVSGDGDFINLLFTQDSDILGFGDVHSECDGCGFTLPPDEDGYIYPTGACSTTHTEDNNSADGDGEPDGNSAGPYPYTTWECVFSSSITIEDITTLGVNWSLSGSGQVNFYMYATIDGVEYFIGNWDLQSGAKWIDAGLSAYEGQELQSVRWRAKDRGIGPDPWHYIDGVRVYVGFD